MKAYVLDAQDGDFYYYEKAPSELFCKSCDSFVGEEAFFPDSINIKKKDLCCSYDGQLVLSSEVKLFLEKNVSTEVHFVQVNHKPPLYVMDILSTLKFDSEKRQTCFLDFCDTCGQYESIVGATPAFLKLGSEVDKNGIYITDVIFGSGREKSPLIILGEDIACLLSDNFRDAEIQSVRF